MVVTIEILDKCSRKRKSPAPVILIEKNGVRDSATVGHIFQSRYNLLISNYL